MKTCAHPGQKWGGGGRAAEHHITWGGAMMPPVQNLHKSLRRDYLHKYYLPKMQEDCQPPEVMQRLCCAAMGNRGRFESPAAQKAKVPLPMPPTPRVVNSRAPGSSRSLSSSTRSRSLHRSTSEPTLRKQRIPGSMAIATDSGRYGCLWLPPHATSSKYGIAPETPNQVAAGPSRLFGPVAQMTMGLEPGRSRGDERGSSRIRFSESCCRTPQPSCC